MEEGDSDDATMESIIEGFSRLLQQLNSDEAVETDGKAGRDSGVQKLKRLYEEISGIQEGVEKFRLFKEGQDLYTKWLMLVEQSDSGVKLGDCSSKDLQNVGGNKAKLKDLIALAYNNRGYLKYLQVDFKGALEDYTVALRHNPDLACAYYNRGLVTYRLAFFEQSVRDMTAAVRLDSSKTEFREGLKKASEMVGTPNEHKFSLEYGDEGREEPQSS